MVRTLYDTTQVRTVDAASAAKVPKAAAGGKKTEERAADLSRLNLRVGLIKKAWRHPDADSLYVEEIECGEAQPRQVCLRGVAHLRSMLITYKLLNGTQSLGHAWLLCGAAVILHN